MTYNKSVSALKSEGWIADNSVLVPEHDAARVHCGGAWRIPTEADLANLCNRCDWTLTKKNGVKGYVIKGKGSYSSVSIFLPSAGSGSETSRNGAGERIDYWASMPYSSTSSTGSKFSACLYDTTSNPYGSEDYLYISTYYNDRYKGFPIRPVISVNE